jgi:ABC-2 type transport system permease protein
MTSVRKIGLVAKRDFVATVATKGFVFGLLIVPAIFALFALVGPRVMDARSPQVVGDVAIIDSTGRVAGELRASLAPSAIEARRSADARRAMAQAAPGAEALADDQAIRRAIGQVPVLTLHERPADVDVQREKTWLTAQDDGPPHLALVVVHADAVARADAAGEFGSYDLYASRGLNDATETALHESLRDALVNARLKASRLDQSTVAAIMRVPRPRSTVVSIAGEQQTQRGLTRLLPLLLGVLMFVGIMMGGQGLMTSTVEEKSSRVVEVLLASVSPFELLAGKLIAQLGVGLIAIGVYVALGFLALFQFAMFGLVDPILVVYLIVFYMISYLVFGALMMAIGAAVNQMNEAQSLFGPVMLVLMVPYLLSPIIGRAPNSTFSTVMSFVPPVNTFVMMSRLASDSPPPAWQVWLTVLVGCVSALAAVWFASKVFRIGLLMHGKPPNFATLLRWARAA